MIITEEWKIIESFPRYAISNLGRVKRISAFGGATVGRILKPSFIGKGYLSVMFYERTAEKLTQKRKYVHRLVAEFFINKKNEIQNQVNHKDGNKENNRIDNLEWASCSENHLHAFRIGLRKPYRHSKLCADDVIEIRNTIKSHGYRIKLSKKFKVSKDTISSIVDRRRWKHI